MAEQNFKIKLRSGCNGSVFEQIRIIRQVAAMLSQCGNDEKFDAERWVDAWLFHLLPALGGVKPADYMGTIEGQERVYKLIAQSHFGVYA